MITFLLIIGLIISLGLNVIAFILIRNLLKKNSIHEAWILNFKQDVVNTLANMRSIDSHGSFATRIDDKGKFESDDEVGQIFKELLDLIENLNEKTQ